MKYWWSSVVRDYFAFSKKERTGIVIIILIGISAFFFIPPLFWPPQHSLNKDAFIKELEGLKITIDSSTSYNRNFRNDDESFTNYQPKNNNYEIKGELFEFDPNTINDEGWKRLGVRDKTVQTIRHFLEKGYKFRQPEDIKKIYGLKAAQAERLVAFVRIKTSVETNERKVEKAAYTSEPPSKKYTPVVIDVNEADTTAFIMLPGIGSKLAARIVNYRNKLGGFVSVAQLGETYGLADSVFKMLQPRLQCDRPNPRTINVNTSDAAQLKVHPYISWNIANAIVRYREQHGKYATVSDLTKIDIMGEEVFNKLSPYLVVE